MVLTTQFCTICDRRTTVSRWCHSINMANQSIGLNSSYCRLCNNIHTVIPRLCKLITAHPSSRAGRAHPLAAFALPSSSSTARQTLWRANALFGRLVSDVAHTAAFLAESGSGSGSGSGSELGPDEQPSRHEHERTNAQNVHYLCDKLIECVELGIPLRTLDLRTCTATSSNCALEPRSFSVRLWSMSRVT